MIQKTNILNFVEKLNWESYKSAFNSHKNDSIIKAFSSSNENIVVDGFNYLISQSYHKGTYYPIIVPCFGLIGQIFKSDIRENSLIEPALSFFVEILELINFKQRILYSTPFRVADFNISSIESKLLSLSKEFVNDICKFLIDRDDFTFNQTAKILSYLGECESDVFIPTDLSDSKQKNLFYLHLINNKFSFSKYKADFLVSFHGFDFDLNWETSKDFPLIFLQNGFNESDENFAWFDGREEIVLIDWVFEHFQKCSNIIDVIDLVLGNIRTSIINNPPIDMNEIIQNNPNKPIYEIAKIIEERRLKLSKYEWETNSIILEHLFLYFFQMYPQNDETVKTIREKLKNWSKETQIFPEIGNIEV